jgi:hypothetical protein
MDFSLSHLEEMSDRFFGYERRLEKKIKYMVRF